MEYSKFIYPFQEYIIIEYSTISLTLKGRPPLPSASGVSDKFSILFFSLREILENNNIPNEMERSGMKWGDRVGFFYYLY